MSEPESQQPQPTASANDCPKCGSDRVRRGGRETWMLYILLILVAVPAVVIWDFNATLVAGVMLAGIALVHLVLNQRICLDCGTQWRM